MKREEEFLSSIYEKRDAAVEKRRRTVRAARRAGIGFASLFFVAVISFAAVGGFTRSWKSMEPSAIGAGDAEQAAESGYIVPTGDGADNIGYGKTTDEKPEATRAETVFAEDVREKTDDVGKIEATSAVSTHSPSAPSIDKRIVESVKADGEENVKKDFEKMLVLFGHSGESFGGWEAGYGGKTVCVFKMLTSNGALYLFRYEDAYFCVADPDPDFSAEEAIRLADEAINEN